MNRDKLKAYLSVMNATSSVDYPYLPMITAAKILEAILEDPKAEEGGEDKGG